MADTAPQGLTATLIASLVRRRRVLLAGLVLAGLAWAGAQAWRVAGGKIGADAQFQLTADAVQVPDPPHWVRTDIRQSAIARAATLGPLSVLDPQSLNPRLVQAFQLEPWVKSVRRVEVLPTRQVLIDLEWRQPFAAVELLAGDRTRLLLIDANLVRLPDDGLPEAELRRLPRIRAVNSAPPLGEVWGDRRVADAALLIARLGNDWARLSLADVTPGARPEGRGDLQFYRFDLTTTGGTQIIWGVAPNAQQVGEAPFDLKLARLKQFVQANRVELHTHRSPRSIDLRYGLDAKRRIAKKKQGNRTAQKDDHAEDDAEIVK